MTMNMKDYIMTLKAECPACCKYQKNELAKWLCENLGYKQFEEIATYGVRHDTSLGMQGVSVEKGLEKFYHHFSKAIAEICAMYEDETGRKIIESTQPLETVKNYIDLMTCAAIREIACHLIHQIDETKKKMTA